MSRRHGKKFSCQVSPVKAGNGQTISMYAKPRAEYRTIPAIPGHVAKIVIAGKVETFYVPPKAGKRVKIVLVSTNPGMRQRDSEHGTNRPLFSELAKAHKYRNIEKIYPKTHNRANVARSFGGIM